jgi:hypothetical protein
MWLFVAIGMAVFIFPASGQDLTNEIRRKLNEQFVLTKMSTSGNVTNIAVGSVLVLHKEGLLMCSSNAVALPTTIYKDGAFSLDVGDSRDAKTVAALAQWGTPCGNVAQRKVRAGLTLWILELSVDEDFVMMKLHIQPPYDLYGLLKFPYIKGGASTADDVVKTIAEVVTLQPPVTATQPPVRKYPDGMDVRLRSTAGANAENCGTVEIRGDATAANDCVQKALSESRPFYVRYRVRGTDSILSTGLAGSVDGTVYEMHSDAMCWNCNPRITTEECPTPVKLRPAWSGALTCRQ